MRKIRLYKNYGVLVPGDDKAEKVIESMKSGQAMDISYSLPRNYNNHKRFFAFIKATFSIQDHFDNIDTYRYWIIMKSGYCITAIAPNGNTFFLPESLSFEKMDEVTFKDMFSKSIDSFLSAWGDRISRDELLQIVEFV